MFVSNVGYSAGYSSDGAQWARGLYLVVMDHPEEKYPGGRKRLRAFVRRASLRQMGNFMPGTIRATIDGRKIVIAVEGTYGNTGLPHDPHFKDHYDKKIPYEQRPFVDLWSAGHDVPEDLAEAFWSGDGHNGAGREGPLMRAWAEKNLAQLRRWARAPAE